MGTKLRKGDVGSATNFVDVAGLRNINGPNFSVDFDEVTELLSTNQWKEFIACVKEQGEVSATITYDMNDSTLNGTDGVIADIKNANGQATLRYWRIQFPNGYYFEFQAMVANFSVVAAKGSSVTATLTLRPSGAPSAAA